MQLSCIIESSGLPLLRQGGLTDFVAFGLQRLQQLIGSAALGAIAPDFQAAYHNVKAAFALDLTFEPVK